MKTWDFILAKLQIKQAVALLYVLDNKGSSPGRKGFKMAIAEDGHFVGTIGGGIMEVKLLELAKNKLQKKENSVLIKKQYHDKKHPSNQSGMICSGEQTVAIIPLENKDLKTIKSIVNKEGSDIKISIDKNGIKIATKEQKEQFIQLDEEDNFKVIISLNTQKRVHIFGGGHVGLALSQVLSLLDYYVLIYDDRPDLNTLQQNHFAHETLMIDFEKINEIGNFKPDDAAVIVTFSYRLDKLLLKQLFQKTFSYIGMMGSDAKIKTLNKELAEEGISSDKLSHIAAPIGLGIFSKTAMEIAISIAGQMILERNKALPTGRKNKALI